MRKVSTASLLSAILLAACDSSGGSAASSPPADVHSTDTAGGDTTASPADTTAADTVVADIPATPDASVDAVAPADTGPTPAGGWHAAAAIANNSGPARLSPTLSRSPTPC